MQKLFLSISYIAIDLTALTVIYGTLHSYWERITLSAIKPENNVSLHEIYITGRIANAVRNGPPYS